jgi:hypothetical protein
MMRAAIRRLAVSIGCLAAGWAAPPLTTIQDVLYKADGSTFNGIVFIQWRSFEASDTSNIATNSLTSSIVNGVLRVRLVPTTTATPGASYAVKYSIDGRVQFEETWAVPPSSTVQRVRDVRVVGAGNSSGGTVTPPAPATEVLESDVVGLLADLAVRPVKAPGYAPSRAIYADASGALEAVAGNLTDCVRVDGTAGPCGTSGGGSIGTGFTDGETPAGLINGSNTVFTLANAPSPTGSLALYRNGLLQSLGLDYTLAANVITFASLSAPRSDDLLTASYRLADPSIPVGQAGGALTGTYPDPSLGTGVVFDANIAVAAGIRESKLALDFPTHSSANDPTAVQKAALSGTSGDPSVSNKYVLDQDPRMSNSRAATAHALLSAIHSDTTAAAAARGDLIVAQGTAPVQWARVPIGLANRCLMSNGLDAVWNTCLYTGFTAGSIPFVDSSGNLAQNNALLWDNLNRRMSIGNSTSGATLYLYDGLPSTGTTGLVVRAGQGQNVDPLQRWLGASGAELARVDWDGRFTGASFRATTSTTRAAWQDPGSAADPSTVTDGDLWFNNTQQSHKTVEASQTHTLPEVLCGSAGTATSATGLTRLGSCTIPANFLKPGDRVDVRFDYSHEGTGTGFSFEVRWGASVFVSRSSVTTEAMASGKADAGVHSAGAQLSTLSWGSTLTLQSLAVASSDSLAAPLTVDFLGKMNAVTGETVTLRNFTVVRYPAQQNP